MSSDRRLPSLASGRRRSLARESEGAIMILGLMMATTLIGALWYLFGVAQTTLYREKRQEVADHVAFSSAVLHARGMNALVATNLAVTGLDLSYLTFRSIKDFLAGDPPDRPGFIERLTSCAKGVVTAGPGGNAACLQIQEAHVAEILAAGELRRRTIPATGDENYAFENRQRLLQRHMFDVARAVPWMATAAAAELAEDYTAALAALSGQRNEMVGISLGASNFPSPSATGLNDEPWGLPVVAGDRFVACHYLFQSNASASTRLEAWLGAALPQIRTPLVDLAKGVNAVRSGAPEVYAGAVGDSLSLIRDYCSSHFRGRPGGVKLVDRTDGVARNGTDHFQVFSWIFATAPEDTVRARDRVGFVAKIFGRANDQADLTPSAPTNPTYFAQGEFYFDCMGRWTQADCEGSDPLIHGSMLHIGWKARLRHFRPPGGDVRGRIEGFVLGSTTGGIMSALTPGAESTDSFLAGVGTLSNRLQRAVGAAQSPTTPANALFFPLPTSTLRGAYGNGVYH